MPLQPKENQNDWTRYNSNPTFFHCRFCRGWGLSHHLGDLGVVSRKDPSMKNFTRIRNEVNTLIHLYPELLTDSQLKLDMLEGEVNFDDVVKLVTDLSSKNKLTIMEKKAMENKKN